LATGVIAQKQETRKRNLFIHNKGFKPKNQGEFKIMNQIEQKLDSREVAGMVGKRHKNLLSDIRGYVEELNELKIQPVDFFRETVYKDAKGQERPCYDITKKGCEFIAHKLTGIKGTEFTARYINRFHDMEDIIREEIPKKQDKPKKEKLPSVNMMVKNIKEALHDAGVDSKYIAAEVVRIYSDSGYPVNAPLISDTPKLWDCTTIARELGIFSETGRPHDKAVSAIIQKLDLFTDEIVRTAYSWNGHDGVTMQYKESVFQKVKEWLQENGYPTVIELELANGNVNKCRVVYGEVA
jgi:Rha family phage regulatory protein